jgi:hypothetical protein|tara:strand:- start:63 stop:290 length:228 start_codon:yes stop_codon:yes gene_type:complete
MTVPSNPTITVKNPIVVSQLECKDILHRLEECRADLKMLSTTEPDLELHLNSLVKLVTAVVQRQQPSQNTQEVPI